tara:strand:- start:365 stop:604 length:240 start_codon:yes stop_codon:yes gene_type:complete
MNRSNEEVKNDEYERYVLIQYVEDYGGVKAWIFTEYINGEDNSGGTYKVAKREHFSTLHEICQTYIERGYTIRMKEYKS